MTLHLWAMRPPGNDARKGMFPAAGQTLSGTRKSSSVSPPGRAAPGVPAVAETHRGDVEGVLVLPLSEVGQLGHPVELLVELLEQSRGVEHLLLVGPQQLVVLPGQLLRQLQGAVQLPTQQALRGVAAGAVCPERENTKGLHVKGKSNGEETRWESVHEARTWSRAGRRSPNHPSSVLAPECSPAGGFLHRGSLVLENCQLDYTGCLVASLEAGGERS